MQNGWHKSQVGMRIPKNFLDTLDKKSYNLRAYLPDQPGELFR